MDNSLSQPATESHDLDDTVEVTASQRKSEAVLSHSVV